MDKNLDKKINMCYLLLEHLINILIEKRIVTEEELNEIIKEPCEKSNLKMFKTKKFKRKDL